MDAAVLRILAVLVGAITLGACTASSARYTRMGAQMYPARADNCSVDVYRNEVPTRKYLRIARLDARLERGLLSQPSFEEALAELKKQACLAGADAMIDVQDVRGAYLEVRIRHVVATGIKYQ